MEDVFPDFSIVRKNIKPRFKDLFERVKCKTGVSIEFLKGVKDIFSLDLPFSEEISKKKESNIYQPINFIFFLKNKRSCYYTYSETRE